MSRHPGGSEERQYVKERCDNPLLLGVFGSELLQGLLVGHEQCDPNGVRVVVALEATDT